MAGDSPRWLISETRARQGSSMQAVVLVCWFDVELRIESLWVWQESVEAGGWWPKKDDPLHQGWPCTGSCVHLLLHETLVRWCWGNSDVGDHDSRRDLWWSHSWWVQWSSTTCISIQICALSHKQHTWWYWWYLWYFYMHTYWPMYLNVAENLLCYVPNFSNMPTFSYDRILLVPRTMMIM